MFEIQLTDGNGRGKERWFPPLPCYLVIDQCLQKENPDKKQTLGI